MDFNYIEALVSKCKNNDEGAKEKLAAEFRPLIYNISKKIIAIAVVVYLLIRLDKQINNLSNSINKLNIIISTKLGVVIDTNDFNKVV